VSKVESAKQTQETHHAWTPDQALELWRHYAGVGGADKNTMVTIASLLLTFSATIIGYTVTKLFEPGSATERWTAISLSILGIGFSGLAGYIAVLYGGYAMRNWAEADRIARDRQAKDPQWKALVAYEIEVKRNEKAGKLPRLAALARRWSRPTNHATEVPKVFKIFAVLGLVSALTHLGFLIRTVILHLR